MPFEIAPQEPTLAEKLAALIETGRACNPNVVHTRGKWFREGSACVMGYALLAVGIKEVPEGGSDGLAAALGLPASAEFESLMRRVIDMNDSSRASVDEIVKAIRTNEFPIGNYAQISVDVGDMVAMMKKTFALQAEMMQQMNVVYYGSKVLAHEGISKWIVEEISMPTVKAIPQPSKKLRVSAKTGASWPVAKHAYA